jgi:DNA-binding SARP family transcriptional activator
MMTAPDVERVRRRRVLALLADRFDVSITVIRAGAGYGKSTVLAQALDESAHSADTCDVVVAVRERHGTPEQLMASLSAALTGNAAALATVDDVRDHIILRSPVSVALVFDDVHLIDGSPSIELLRELLDHLPANGHLVLASRTMPELAVRRRQVAGDALVIEETDLAFDSDEMAAYVALAQVPSTMATELPSWPAMAVLMASLGRSASIGYLWEEVLADLDTDRLQALALVARFETIDDDLVRAVLGPSWTAGSLVAGLPLVDETPIGHRMHDLWRTALADTVPPTEWRAALVAGAEVLLARGDNLRGARALHDAGAYDRIRALVRHMAALSISAGMSPADFAVLRDLLPTSDRTGSLGRCIEYALSTTATEIISAVETLLVAAREDGDDELRSLAIWRMVQFMGETDPASLPDITDETYELAEAGWPLARSAIALWESHAAEVARDLTGALTAAERIESNDPQTRRVAIESRMLALGQPEMLSATLESVLAEGLSDPVAAHALWLRGEVDPDLAWQLASGMPGLYGRRRFPSVQVPLLGVLSSVALAAGDLQSAARLATDALAMASQVTRRAGLFAHVADISLLVCEDEDSAVERLEQTFALHALGPWPAWAYTGILTLARARIADTEWLDDLDLGPSLRVAVDAGRALERLRTTGDRTGAATLPWHQQTLLRVHVPAPLLTELALAAVTRDADACLDVIPHRERWIRRLADHPHPTVRDRARALIARHPVRPAFDIEVTTFGGLTVTRSDGVELSPLVSRSRFRQLLISLLLNRSQTRSALAMEIWPDMEPDRAAMNLRVTLFKMLEVMEPDRERDTSWFIRATADRVDLVDDGITVDSIEFDRHLAAARSAEASGVPSEAYEHYVAAIGLHTGPFLPESDDSAVFHERVRLQSLAHGAACRAAELQLARGNPELALGHATVAQRIDDLGERAPRLMIRCHLALGSTAAAAAVAQRLLDTLEQHRLTPEAETRRLLDTLDSPRP